MGDAAAKLKDEHIHSALDNLQRGLKQAGGRVQLACSFSIEDVVVIDLARGADLPVGVFAIDTGRLPEETYMVAESVARRYQLDIDWFFPKAEQVETLERQKGLFSFRESLDNRHECCAIRKVEPLQRALQGLAGWVTGMRRQQGLTREAIEPIAADAAHGHIVKINPLCHWSEAQVWDYARQQRIPIHPLHKQGYPSVGCAPCTRAVEAGEDVRAGRWWWENPEHKECGLHRHDPKPAKG